MEQLRQRFPLVQADTEAFFPEWREALPVLTRAEQAELDKVHHRSLAIAIPASAFLTVAPQTWFCSPG